MNKNVQSLATLIVLLALSVLLISCSFGMRQQTGADIPVDMLVYIKDGTTIEEDNYFWDHVIGRPTDKEGEFVLLPGIQGAWRCHTPLTHTAICIDFSFFASRRQKEFVRTEVSTSPIVVKILEDVKPGEITAAQLEQ